MRRPRLNALRTFEVVGRRLSFSLAAEELHITQAAVSQQIRQLEAELGSALFHRHHRRISLTDAAQGYLPDVQKALELLNEATERQFGATRNRNVTIRCTSSIATHWLAPHMRDYQIQHPDITLHIRTLKNAGGDVSQDVADIEIFCSGERNLEPGLTTLFDAAIKPVAAPGYVDRKLQHLDDILGFDLIHVVGYDDDWHRWFSTYQRAGRMVPDGLSVDSSQFAIDAAIRGDGIHLGRDPFIDVHLQSGALVEVFDQPLHLHTTYFMRVHRQAQEPRDTRKVAAWIDQLALGQMTGREPI